MRIGFLGLGKLGLPVALAVERKGHTVVGHDPSPSVQDSLANRIIPFREEWAQDYIRDSRIEHVDVPNLVLSSEIVFVAVQTPHHPRYEGITRVPDERMDFDYSYLVRAMRDLSAEIGKLEHERVVVVISTVLPGTIRREIIPLIENNRWLKLCYNPFFIAMGSTIRDFFHPEFVLLGTEDSGAASKMEAFYRTLHHAPVYQTTLENAEAIKVLYNTFISTKIAFANTVMELCHKLPNTNVDDVMNGLKLGNQRIISDKYLSGGMGDGGGCHPRDNIALSWLSDRLGMSYNWFEHVIAQRERHMEWLADLIDVYSAGLTSTEGESANVPLYILGKAFKPETNITTGSPAILLANILKERGRNAVLYDPYVDSAPPHFGPGVYFVATKHDEFATFDYPDHSIVLDPWRYIQPSDRNVQIVHIGDQLQDQWVRHAGRIR